MTIGLILLQLLVFVAAIAGLIAFGFYRDKKEHSPERSGVLKVD